MVMNLSKVVSGRKVHLFTIPTFPLFTKLLKGELCLCLSRVGGAHVFIRVLIVKG